MTLTSNKLENTAVTKAEQKFNWRNCWYPVTFSVDLPKTRPYSFSLYDDPLVLFQNFEGKLICLRDRCPHRAARLSDGQITEGKIECSYHGWQFGNEGKCLHIPQLPDNLKIPVNACVQSFPVVERQGIVWIWAGEFESATQKLIPTIADLDKPEFMTLDFVSDRPYDQTFFIENLLDPAHLPINHDGSLSNRKNAQPLEMELLETSFGGIRSRFRETENKSSNWINLDFLAPNVVSYKYDLQKPGYSGGAVIYSLPLGKGRCRALLRYYSNFSSWKIKLIPRWFDHFFRNRVSEEDLILLVRQQAEIERLAQKPSTLYLPLNTSDTILIEYRKWLDKFASSWPFYLGYSTLKLPRNNNKYEHNSVLFGRYSRHTQICSSCSQAYRVTNKVKQISMGLALALFALSVLVNNYTIQIVAISTALLVIGMIARITKIKFEQPYTRH